MALITICDICGKKLAATRHIVTIKRIAMTNLTYDLCPDCMTEMVEWVKEKTKDKR